MNAENPTLESISASCLCGGVTIALRGVKPLVDVCHCSMCRIWGGGPFMGISGTGFDISRDVIGTDLVTHYVSSDWAERAFCRCCGTNLWFRFVPGNHYSFAAGLFELGSGAKIEQQIFVDEKPVFYDFAQETPMKTGAEIIAEAVAAGHKFGGQPS